MTDSMLALLAAAGETAVLTSAIAQLPHDAGAIFVYILLSASAALIVLGSRPGRRGPPGED